MITSQKIQDIASNPRKILEYNKEDIHEIFKTLDNEYYNNGNSLVSDAVYDKIKKLTKYKPNNVGASIKSGKKTKLPYWMGSQNKLVTQKTIEHFYNKHSSNNKFIISDKLDGISALLYYDKGKIRMYTRGDGVNGQDITHLIKPLGISITKIEDTVAIRGELVIKNRNIVNARNIVAGFVNRKEVDEKILQYVRFVAYQVVEPDNILPSKHKSFVKKHTQGVEYVHHTITSNIEFENLKSILKNRKDLSEYDIDGLVILPDKVNKLVPNENPKYSFAFKDNSILQSKETTVENIEWNVSKDGYIKPTIILKPIQINGVTIKRTSGFNASFILTQKVAKGTRVIITRSGDIIPYIKQVFPLKTTYSEEELLPNNIEWEWTKSKTDIVIVNKDNQEQILKNIEFFYNIIKVKGLSTATLKKLYNTGYDTPYKVYSISKEELAKVLNSTLVAEKIVQERTKTFENLNIIDLMHASNSFGRSLGIKKIDLIMKEFNYKLENLQNTTNLKNQIQNIHGVGQITADQFVEGINEFSNFCKTNAFIAISKNNQQKQNANVKSDTLKDNVVLFTGFRDSNLENLVSSHGGTIVSSFSKKVTLLVVKDYNVSNAKTSNAEKNNIRIISSTDLASLIK